MLKIRSRRTGFGGPLNNLEEFAKYFRNAYIHKNFKYNIYTDSRSGKSNHIISNKLTPYQHCTTMKELLVDYVMDLSVVSYSQG